MSRRASAEVEPSSAAYWVERASLVLRRSIYSRQGTEECLARIGLSYRQLCRHFQTEMGISPKQFQLRTRLDEAARLVRSTKMGLTDIAFELGFSSSQHFSTAFAKQYDVSPGAYRRRH